MQWLPKILHIPNLYIIQTKVQEHTPKDKYYQTSTFAKHLISKHLTYKLMQENIKMLEFIPKNSKWNVREEFERYETR